MADKTIGGMTDIGALVGTELVEVESLTGPTSGNTSTQDIADLSSTKGLHHVWVPATAMKPSASGGCAALATVASAADQPDITSLDFDPSTPESAEFSLRLPKRWDAGSLYFIPIWSHPATTTNFGVAWSMRAVALADGNAIAQAFGTAVVVLDAGGTTDSLYVGVLSGAITAANTAAKQDTVFFKITRATANAGDTMAVDARLHGVVVAFTSDAESDD